MTDELSTDAKDFLSLATSGSDVSPNDGDRKRVRKGVGVALASGAAGLAASSASLKAIIVVALVSGAVGVGAVSLSDADSSERLSAASSPATAPGPQAPAPSTPALLPPIPEPEEVDTRENLDGELAFADPDGADVAADIEANVEMATTPRAARANSRRVIAPTESSETSELAQSESTMSLGDELGLLRAAQRAHVQGDFGEALRQLDAHAHRFPQGRLAAERDGTRVFVLCDAARLEEATRAQARFLRDHPTSPLAHRVRSGCD